MAYVKKPALRRARAVLLPTKGHGVRLREACYIMWHGLATLKSDAAPKRRERRGV